MITITVPANGHSESEHWPTMTEYDIMFRRHEYRNMWSIYPPSSRIQFVRPLLPPARRELQLANHGLASCESFLGCKLISVFLRRSLGFIEEDRQAALCTNPKN